MRDARELRRVELLGFPRVVSVCAAAALAAVAVLIGGAIDSDALVYADGGADAREQAAVADESGDGIRDYALGIWRALTDHSANRWARHWRARAGCDAVAAHKPDGEGAAAERFLRELVEGMCVGLEAGLGVNPGDYLPRGGERTVGLVGIEPGAAVGYTLFTGRWHDDVFLIDPLGRVAHIWPIDLTFYHGKMLDNGGILATTNSQRRAFEFDALGNVVWEYRIPRLHHDFLKMPNGNVMLLSRNIKTREDVIAAGANPEFVHENGLDYDYLVEVRPTGASGGEVVWEWSAWDHIVQEFDPSKPNYGAVAEHPELIDLNYALEMISEYRKLDPNDWIHTNAIDYNPELEQIMLSPRHFSELWIIDRSTTTEEARGHSGGNGGIGGDLLYRWGNPRAYGQGDAGDQRLFWQHQTHWIPPGLPGAGNVLLFNNGSEFSADYKRRYSSVDEFALPMDGHRYRRAEDGTYPPDELEWTYTAETPEDFYASVISGAQRLPNGNTLVVDGTTGTIFQVTPDGRTVWKYVVPLDRRSHLRQGDLPSVWRAYPTPQGDSEPVLTNTIYRAYWYPPDHPGLQALDLTPGAYVEDLPDVFDLAYAAFAAGDFGERVARAEFDIYLDINEDDKGEDKGERRLNYFKQPCADEDSQAKFFLHIFPADVGDLPSNRQGHGFENLDFNGDLSEIKGSDDWCIAMRRLPDYAIERIRTGQYTDEAGQLWQADIDIDE